MNEEEIKVNIHRILVALDASPNSLAALEAAAEMAAYLKAEVTGLFVEDVNLLDLAELPFARQVNALSGLLQPFDNQDVERQFRVLALRAKQALEQVALRNQVKCSFRIARGRVISEVIAAASAVDLVILGKAGWAPFREKRMGSTAQTIIFDAPCHTLILQSGAHLYLKIIVLCDGTSESKKALNVAARIAGENNKQLTVLIPAKNSESFQQIQSQVNTWLLENGVKASYRQLNIMDSGKPTDFINTESSGILVVPTKISLMKDESFLEMLNTIECPVLYIR